MSSPVVLKKVKALDRAAAGVLARLRDRAVSLPVVEVETDTVEAVIIVVNLQSPLVPETNKQSNRLVLLREEGPKAVLEGAIAGAVEVCLRITIKIRRNLVTRRL